MQLHTHSYHCVTLAVASEKKIVDINVRRYAINLKDSRFSSLLKRQTKLNRPLAHHLRHSRDENGSFNLNAF